MSATVAGSGVATLLVVHHSPGTALPAMVDAALAGARSDGLERLRVAVVSALEVTSAEVLGAAGYLLATPANLGYMSGALKHAFDTTYNDALDTTQGRPYGVLVHGESDTDGALLGIQKIVTGLAWRAVAEPVSVIGSVKKRPDDCRELGAVVAATTLGY